MPHYDLKQIKVLAASQAIGYSGRTIHRRAVSMGYEPCEVARCLQCLSPSDFHKTLPAYDGGIIYDVYKTSYIPSFSNRPDDLYLKIRIIGDSLEIEIGSFKLQTS